MSFSNGPKGIVTDGLVSSLDPANPQSYSSSAAICTDLINSTITGNMFGSLTGSFGSNTSWLFDDSTNSDNYISMDQISPYFENTTDWSVSNWIKPSLDNYTAGPAGRMIWGVHDASGNNKILVFIRQTAGNEYGTVQYFVGSNIGISSSVLPNNEWTHLTTTCDEGITDGTTIYINGEIIPDQDGTINYPATTDKFTIGAEWDSGPSVGDFYSGSMGPTLVYDRILSADEVLQNYEVTKARFGL